MVKIALFSPLPPLVGGMAILGESMYKYFSEEKFNVYKVQAGSGLQGIFPLPSFYFKLFYYSLKVDVFLVLSASGNSLWLKDLPVILIGKLFKKKTILHFNGGMAVDKFIFWKYHRILPFILADRIVVPSKIMKTILKKRINDDKIIVIPNVVEIDTFQGNDANVKSSKLALVAVKALEKYAGYNCLIDGYKKAKNKIDNLKLIIIGSGPEEKNIKDYVIKNQIEDIDFIKNVNHKELAKILKNSTIFVHGSKYESFGLVLVEAMASGLPIISSNVGAIPEIVKENYNGILYEYGDSDALSERIVNLINDETVLNQYSRNSIKLSNDYNWQNIKKYWHQLFSFHLKKD